MERRRGTADSTAGLSADQIARHDAIFRQANDGIRAAAEEHDIGGKVPFVCECADPECRELVRLTLDEYGVVRRDPRQFVNVPGHEASAQGWAEVVARRDGYVVVTKSGRAGEVAEQLAGEPDASVMPLEPG